MECALKFWLACFLLLFVGAELVEWVSHLGMANSELVSSANGVSAWLLILGGMGLAAASNASHLPNLSRTSHTAVNDTEEEGNTEKTVSAEEDATAKLQHSTSAANVNAPELKSMAEQSREDSISFKIRLPWR